MWFLTWWLRVIAVFALVFRSFVRKAANTFAVDFDVTTYAILTVPIEYILLFRSDTTIAKQINIPDNSLYMFKLYNR